MATASKFGDLLAASTAKVSIDLLVDWAYAVAHNGQDVAGAAVTDTIILSHDGVATADMSAEAGKIPLLANRAIVLPAGHRKLYYQTAANAPTFTLMPVELMVGRA